MNCQRVQSLLSAYLDSELTGEEMFVIRSHMSTCEFCSDEFNSLSVVKKLLGSLQSAQSNEEWSTKVSTAAYAGNKAWWEKPITTDSFFIQFGSTAEVSSLTPRGVRMVRALAISTVFVFFVASPFASRERFNDGVTGKIAGTMDVPMMPWTSDQPTKLQSLNSVFQAMGEQQRNISPGLALQPSPTRDETEAASMMPGIVQPSWSGDSSLTFVSTGEK